MPLLAVPRTRRAYTIHGDRSLAVEIGFGCTKQLCLLVVLGWVGLGQSADGLVWIGSHEMEPWTTLWYIGLVGREEINSSEY